jgi:peptide deformylase
LTTVLPLDDRNSRCTDDRTDDRTDGCNDPTQASTTTMALLTILEFPDPRLRTVAKPVAVVDNRIRRLVADMLETMYAAPGIGLAATQVDVHEQVIVIDLSEEKNQPLVFINPQIEVLDGETLEYDEGCLSVPGFYEPVRRPTHVRVKALDGDGKPFEIEPDGLLAICIQHEIDHLRGKLYVDYLSPLKRNRIKKKLQKQQRASA